MRKLLSVFTIPLLAVGFLLAKPQEAKADFKVCNQGSETAFTAVSYKQDNRWFTEGWFLIDSNNCTTGYYGSVSNKKMLIHAQTVSGGEITTGSSLRCIIYYQQQKNYRIGDSDNPNRCKATNRGMAGFRSIPVTKKDDNSFDLTD
jgi:uncharacterized membrane protein